MTDTNPLPTEPLTRIHIAADLLLTAMLQLASDPDIRVTHPDTYRDLSLVRVVLDRVTDEHPLPS